MILILQNYTDNSSDLPVARKIPCPLGRPGGENVHQLQRSSGQLPCTAAGKIDLTGAETLFDMGCGPGTVSLALADKLHAVHGVDYSPKMLDVAARRARKWASPMLTGTAARGNHRGTIFPAATLPSPPAQR
jgi:SAM-dependent methyltransferase